MLGWNLDVQNVSEGLCIFNIYIFWIWNFQCVVGDIVVEFFEEMEKLGIILDRIIFMGLVLVIIVVGKWEFVQSFIDMM